MFEGLTMNPETIQMLSYALGAVGKGLGGPGSFGDTVGTAGMNMSVSKMAETKEANRSAEFAKLLGQIVGGGGKMTVDSQGFNIKAPHSALETPASATQNTPVSPALKFGTLPDIGDLKIDESLFEGLNAASPSSGTPSFPQDSAERGLDFSKVNLASLRAEDLYNAFNLKSQKEANEWAKMKDIVTIQNMQEDNARAAEKARLDQIPDVEKEYVRINQSRVAQGLSPITLSDFYAMSKNNDILEWRTYRDQGGTLSYEGWNASRDKRRKAAGTTINVGQKAFETDLGHQEANLYDPKTLDDLAKDAATVYDENLKLNAKGIKTRRAVRNDPNPAITRNKSIRNSVIVRYTDMLRAKYGRDNIVRQLNSDGSSSWYKRLPNDEREEIMRY